MLQVECLGAPVLLDEETTIERGEVKRLPLPVRLTAGFTMFEITHPLPSSPLAANGALQTISRPVYGPPIDGDPIDGDQDWSKHPLRNRAPLGETPSPTELAEWFETLLRGRRPAHGASTRKRPARWSTSFDSIGVWYFFARDRSGKWPPNIPTRPDKAPSTAERFSIK